MCAGKAGECYEIVHNERSLDSRRVENIAECWCRSLKLCSFCSCIEIFVFCFMRLCPCAAQIYATSPMLDCAHQVESVIKLRSSICLGALESRFRAVTSRQNTENYLAETYYVWCRGMLVDGEFRELSFLLLHSNPFLSSLACSPHAAQWKLTPPLLLTSNQSLSERFPQQTIDLTWPHYANVTL